MRLFVGLFLSVLFISCKVYHKVDAKVDYLQVSNTESSEQDETVANMITPYRAQLEQEMNEVIGYCEEDLIKARPESSLGNWTADAIYNKALEYYRSPIDFAIQNYGGLRIPVLRKGPITRSAIYELMPFDNKIVIVHLDGPTLDALLDHIAEQGGWPVSHHLQFEIKNGLSANVLLRGEPVEEGRSYRVAMPDFIANGGDGSFFLEKRPRDELQIMIRDALIEYVQDQQAKQQAIRASLEGRIQESGQ
jgi:2',3'-cyclic-nucleotide 2'-phosphodiesterase (5'-nucleotidase family)